MTEIELSDIECETSKQISTWVYPRPSNGSAFRCCCRDCQVTLKNQYDLRQHLICWHSSEDEADGYSCSVLGCDQDFIDRISLIRHLHFHHFQASRQADSLNRLSTRTETSNLTHCGHKLGNTNAIVYDGSVLVCFWDRCMFVFDSMFDYLDHVNGHIGMLGTKDRVDFKYFCVWKDCKQAFKSKTNLRWHVHHHSGDKQACCPFCACFFANFTKLIDHTLRKTKNCRLKCFLCQKTFPTQRLLREHVRRHVKNYKCDFCAFTVETPSDLRSHILKRHSTIRPFSCTTCLKAFYSKADLQRHAVVHQSERTFVCKLCKVGFKWKKLLAEHQLRKHSNEDLNRYLCHLCSTKFQMGVSLSRHLRDEHGIRLPAGQSRFQYKKCADGFLRLQTERYESDKLAALIDNEPVVQLELER